MSDIAIVMDLACQIVKNALRIDYHTLVIKPRE